MATEQRGPASSLVPVLHGQPSEFLLACASILRRQHALRAESCSRSRQELTEDSIDKLATYYSSRCTRPHRTGRAARAGKRGGARDGRRSGRGRFQPASRVMADGAENFPRLAGQNAPYMANRLRLWKSGLPPRPTTDAIMAPIARLLSDAADRRVVQLFRVIEPAAAASGRSAMKKLLQARVAAAGFGRLPRRTTVLVAHSLASRPDRAACHGCCSSAERAVLLLVVAAVWTRASAARRPCARIWQRPAW